MDFSSFKLAARNGQQQLGHPVASLKILQDVADLLRETKNFSSDVDYMHLCELLLNRLKEQVNPYRHLTVLDDYQEPAQLKAIEPWLQLWTETLATLPCAAARIPDWHRTYDVALNRALTALLKQRLGFPGEAAESWTEAGTICRRWLDQNRGEEQTLGYKRIEADYYFFDSRASRAEGEDALNRRCHEPERFDEVAALFESALNNMKISNDLSASLGRQVATQEVVQLEYLTSVSKYRAALLRREFPQARILLKEIGSSAPHSRMKLLPYFRYIKEVEREHLLLEAHEALAAGDVPRSVECMQTWKSAWPASEVSVRSKWLEIRAAALALLNGPSSALAELDGLLESPWGLGRANRAIHSACTRFAKGEIEHREVADVVLRFFPLDAAPRRTEADLKPQGNMRWLPAFYNEWLDANWTIAGRGRLVYLHWHYAVMICEFLCGLYKVKVSRGQAAHGSVTIPEDFRLVTFGQLRELLLGLNYAMNWSGTSIKEVVDGLEVVIETMKVGDAIGVTENLQKNFQELFNKTAAFLLPLPLQVVTQELLPDGQVSIRLRRTWAMSGDSLELVCREAKGLREGQFVLMKPKFKFKPGHRYDEAMMEVFNLYNSSVLGVPNSGKKYALLLEGAHDEVAFRILLDEFIPYWNASIELHTGGGSSLPEKWNRLKEKGYHVVTIADGDKSGEWDELAPFWLSPDFEGVDETALAEAVNTLWAQSVGRVDEKRISLILREEAATQGIVRKLRNYFLRTTHISLPDENEMKKRLRSVISDSWVKRRELPKAVAAPLFYLLESAFGFKKELSSLI